MKKTLALVAVLALIAGGTLSAKPKKGGSQMGSGQMGPGQHHCPHMKGEGKGMHGGKMMVIKAAGLEKVAEKYQIEIEKLRLDHKEATIDLRDKKQKLHKEVAELTDEYDSNPGKVGPEIAKRMKQINNIQKKLAVSREDLKSKIQAVKAEQKKAVQAGVDKWINTLENDPDAMKKFVGQANRMKKMPHKMGHKGMK